MNKNILLIPILLFLCTGTAFPLFDSFFNKSQMVENIIQDLEEEMFCEHLLEIFIENKEKSDKEIIDLLIANSNEKNIAEVSKTLSVKRAALRNDIFYLKIRKIVDYKNLINIGLATISASAALFTYFTYRVIPWYGYLRPQPQYGVQGGDHYYNFNELYMYNKSDLDAMNNDIDITQQRLNVCSNSNDVILPNQIDDPLEDRDLLLTIVHLETLTKEGYQKDLAKYQQEAAKIQQSLKEQSDYIMKPIIISIISLLAIPLISLKNYKKINAEIAEKNDEITQINAILRLCRKYKATLPK